MGVFVRQRVHPPCRPYLSEMTCPHYEQSNAFLVDNDIRAHVCRTHFVCPINSRQLVVRDKNGFLQGLIRKRGTDFTISAFVEFSGPRRRQGIEAVVWSSVRTRAHTQHPQHATLAREAAADASARKRKAAADASARKRKAADTAAPTPEESVMGDAALVEAVGEGVDSNPVSVDSTMGGDYYYACCGDSEPEKPEGSQMPYIGNKEPLSTLAAEFQSGCPILQEKIRLLGEQYDALRRTQGDGNCFYRSFMFSYLEHILETQDKLEVERMIKDIQQCKETLKSLGYAEFTFEDFFSIFIEQLENVLQGHETSMGPEELLERTRDQMISDYVVMFFRFVTAGEIQKRTEFFEPFISGLTNSTVAQFCKASVEPMGEESDHVHIIALSDALGVPIRVIYLDRSSCDPDNLSVNHHDFIPAASLVEGDAAMTSTRADKKPHITLLYRPGHYDILYPRVISA